MSEGIIVGNISDMYMVESDDIILECNARGKFKKKDIIPVVGDFVKIEIIDKKNNKAVINEVLKRDTYIKRPRLSNITQLILVISAKMPKPDLLMLDKQLVFAKFSNIKPIIVINKIDLDIENSYLKIEKDYSNIGYKVINTNAKLKEGIKEIYSVLDNNISAFAGNSGVGKSTLINAIFDKDITKEGVVSIKNKRGKNTTTSTKLYKINSKTYIADTPGFSTFDISEIDSKTLEKYFIEFEEYSEKCEFLGCSHIKERKCGIKDAVDNGTISRARYERYCKIYNELKEKELKKW